MTAIKDAYSTQDVARLLGVTPQTMTRRASRESWQSRPRSGRGGGSEWLVASMPEKTRVELASRLASATRPAVSAASEQGLVTSGGLAGKPRSRAEARAAVLLLARVFTAGSGLARIPALDLFAAKWNAGEIEASPEVRAALPKVCRNSLVNWEKQLVAGGVARLGGRYGAHRKGTGCIDTQSEVRDLVLGAIMDTPDSSVQLLLEGLHALNSERVQAGLAELVLPSLRRLQEWVSRWKRDNAQLFQFIKAPDTWRSRFMASCGTGYELITRYNQLWEYDGTPADLLLADGKRYTIVGVINVYSRELKLEVAPTSSARVVANLTRRAVLDWGVPEEAVTDNGKEFVSAHMQQLMVSLDILPTILPPFRPDLKPAIERAFRTFSHHLLTYCPCYVGHNVATRQEIRERNTFAKRLFEKDAQLGMAITPEALQRFCDTWTDTVYRHRPHKGLHGKTPFAMRQAFAGEVRRIGDERALDLLLVPLASHNGWRTVGKKGVGAGGGRYDHEALGALRGQQVQVRVDRSDVGHAYIFDEDGAFVCKAVEVTGLAQDERRQLAIAIRRAQRTYVRAGATALRGMAAQADAAHLGERILAHHVARAEAIEAAARDTGTLVQTVLHTTEALEQAGAAMRESHAPLAHSAPVQAARDEARAALAPRAAGWEPPASPVAQARLYGRLHEAHLRGEEPPAEQGAWMRIFEQSQLYYGFAATYGWQKLARAVGQ